MDWKVLAALGIGVAVVAGSGGKTAPKTNSSKPEGSGGDSGGDGLSEREQAELLLIGCKQDAEAITGLNFIQPYGVRYDAAVAAYDAAADLYDDGEDDPFELAVAAMDAMLPGCDWGLLSETFTSEELGFGALFRVWEAADRIAYKVIADEPLDIYDPGNAACAPGWTYMDTEWGTMCVKDSEVTFTPVDPVETGFMPNANIPGGIDL